MMMKSYWGKAIAVLPKPMQDRTGRPLLNVVFNVNPSLLKGEWKASYTLKFALIQRCLSLYERVRLHPEFRGMYGSSCSK